MIRFLCAALRHPCQWHPYTYRNLTLAIKVCPCGKNAEGQVISSEPVVALVAGEEHAVRQWVH